MSVDTLTQFIREMDRLAAAGTNLVGNSESLPALQKAIEQLAKKVPSLSPIAKGIETLLQANAKEAASPCLDLFIMTQSLRRSLTVPEVVTGELIENTDATEWQTPVPHRAVESLREKLAESGWDRLDLFRKAHEENRLRDLRLVDPLLRELDRPTSILESDLVERYLPAFGKNLVPDLVKRIDLQGSRIEGRKLIVLSRVDPETARERARRAVEAASPELQIEALKLLGELRDPAIEEIALKLSRARSKPLRIAATQALAGATSEEAFLRVDELLRDDDHETHLAARIALSGMGFPETSARCLKAVEVVRLELSETKENLDRAKQNPDAVRANPKPATKKKSKKSKPEVEQLTDRINRLCEVLRSLVIVLGRRNDVDLERLTTTLLTLREHPEPEIAGVVLDSLGNRAAGSEELYGFLDAVIGGKSLEHARAAIRCWINSTQGFEPPQVEMLLRRLRDSRIDSLARAELLMQYCPRLPDVYLPAVLEEVRSILKHLRQFPFIPAVMSYLRQVRIKAQPLLPDLLDFLPDSNSYYDHIGGLIYEFDPEGTIALPGLKGCLKSTNEFTRSMAADGLACFGERAAEALPMLLYIKEKQENRISESIQKAIRAIRG